MGTKSKDSSGEANDQYQHPRTRTIRVLVPFKQLNSNTVHKELVLQTPELKILRIESPPSSAGQGWELLLKKRAHPAPQRILVWRERKIIVFSLALNKT